MKAPKKPAAKKLVAKKPAKKATPAKAKAPSPPPEAPLRLFVLRTYSGRLLHSVNDLITANRMARELGMKIKVFKRTPEGEVLMSFIGPRVGPDGEAPKPPPVYQYKKFTGKKPG